MEEVQQRYNNLTMKGGSKMILTVQDLLRRSYEMFPDKVALVDRGNGDEETTYAGLEEKSNQFANSLIALGLKKGPGSAPRF